MSGHTPWKEVRKTTKMTKTQQEVLDRLQEYMDLLVHPKIVSLFTNNYMRSGMQYDGPIIDSKETLELIERAKSEWDSAKHY